MEGIIGVVVLVVVCGIGIWIMERRHKKEQNQQGEQVDKMARSLQYDKDKLERTFKDKEKNDERIG